MPIKKLDSDNATVDSELFKSLAISTKPGRYISIEKGPSAASEPKMRIRKKCCFLAIL